MITTEQIAQMSREEKPQAMEALWADLSRNAAEVESPPWHEEALKETAARVADGKALIAEWEEAKRELRNRFE